VSQEDAIYRARREKLERIIQLGIEPYPNRFDRTHEISMGRRVSLTFSMVRGDCRYISRRMSFLNEILSSSSYSISVISLVFLVLYSAPRPASLR